MKAQDLRIGCWYNGGIELNGSLQAKLNANDNKDFLLTKEHFEVLVGQTDWHLMINPIPLTEEWAVKFGYECLVEMACDFSRQSKFQVEITSMDLVNMKVHEAQNLYFALTDEELTIKP